MNKVFIFCVVFVMNCLVGFDYMVGIVSIYFMFVGFIFIFFLFIVYIIRFWKYLIERLNMLMVNIFFFFVMFLINVFIVSFCVKKI